jgi:hypothetical protein
MSSETLNGKRPVTDEELAKCAGGSNRPVLVDNSLHVDGVENKTIKGSKVVIVETGNGTPVSVDTSVHVTNTKNSQVTGSTSVHIKI